MSSGQYGGRVETMDERRQRVKLLLQNLSWYDFVRPSPWVLVPHGSLLGYFDWVPESLRVGPWSKWAMPYLVGLLYLFALATIWVWEEMFHTTTTTTATTNSSYTTLSSSSSSSQFYNWPNWPADQEHHQLYSKFTTAWYYNVAGFVWMTFISSLVYQRARWAPWATYTMHSWTLLQLRHFLAAALPFCTKLPYRNLLLFVTESLRFPALASALITFVMWNFVVGPGIFLLLPAGPQRQHFLQYFTNFRLSQLHVFNMVLAVLHGKYASPSRALTVWDAYVAAVLAIFYLLWYLLVLDRLGVHIYPIFSPRTPWLVVTWTMGVANYLAAFWFWNYLLTLQQE